jgi:hypothetical protein
VRRHRNQQLSYQPYTSHSSPSYNKPSQGEAGGPTVTTLAAGVGNKKSRPDNYGNLGSHDSVPVRPKLAHQRTTEDRPSPPDSSIPLRTAHRNSSSSHLSASAHTISTNVNAAVSASSASPLSNARAPGAVPIHEVFVVHHDGGAPPPVTVYALPGSRVTELPPGYDFAGGRPGSAAGHSPVQPQPGLVGDDSPSVFTTPQPAHRDQKASYTPRPATGSSSTSPQPTSSTFDERARAATAPRSLPSTPQMQ